MSGRRPSEFENVIVLSDKFYQEWMAHPVPNDLEAIKCWPHYLPCWTYGVVSDRCFAAKGMKSRPLFGDFGLASQIGTTGYSVVQAVPRDGRAVAWGRFGHSGHNVQPELRRMDRQSPSAMLSQSFRPKVVKGIGPCSRSQPHWKRNGCSCQKVR